MKQKVAVMTGGTSGIGLFAAKSLADQFETFLVGSRGANSCKFGQPVPLDLSRLDSVRAFCSKTLELCGSRNIDLLVLHAGGSFPHEKMVDGIEQNFAINHLAQYLILRCLFPALAPHGRVIITTSGTHDPNEKTALPVPTPNHADAFRLANPEIDDSLDDDPSVAAGRAYTSSKLCNILTSQALARREVIQSNGIDVIAFSPGPTPGTGLLSARKSIMLSVLWSYVMPVMARLSSKLHTPKQAGDALAKLAMGEITVPKGRFYALLRGGKIVFPPPSELAQDETAIENMWSDSAKLLGLGSDKDI